MKINANMLKIVALAMVVLVGCSQDQVLASLEASVAATEVLVATLQATGKLSPTLANEIENAIAGLPAAFRETASELSSSDNTAEKAVKITAYYSSSVAALQLLPAEAQIYVSAISASIHAFLSGLRPAQAVRSITPQVEAGKWDSVRLNAIGLRAVVLGVQLGDLKARAATTAGEGTR